jgi:hypothetical protein
LTDWTGAQDAVRSPPTAVGYGDPLFAAYYPSCRGLFGLHDPMPPQAAVTYEVLGWYSVAAEDPLATGPNADWLKARYHWIVPDQSPIAHRLVCYARVTIDAASVAATKPPPRVALGASSVSALAALSAAAAAPQRADEIELAMAALTHAAAIAQLDADQAAVLSAAAHESGFVAEAGGILWTLRPDNLPGAPAQAEPANLRNNPLPPTLAVHLDRLNLAQDAFDAAARALHAAREQLLADWSKLAMLLYPQRDQPATPLDPSVVHDFLLHGRGLDGIKAQAAALGTLDLPVEQGGLQVDATGALPVPFDAQGRLALPAAATATLAGRAAALARGSLRKLAVYNATALSGRRDGEPLLEVALPARDGHLLFDGKSALTLDQIEGWGPWPTLGDGRYLTALTIWLRAPGWAGTVAELRFAPRDHARRQSASCLSGRCRRPDRPRGGGASGGGPVGQPRRDL